MKVALLGLGLIGGSLGLAARERAGAEVVGFDPDPDTAAAALRRGAIDRVAAGVPDAVQEADLAFAAAPVGMLPQLVREALEAAPQTCTVSDVGSTKRAVMATAAQLQAGKRFVGGHPLAGAEQGGIERASANLFDGATWFLTSDVTGALPELIEAIGARPFAIDAAEHDRLMARISHLPHVLANLLLAVVAAGGERDLSLAADGPSFRDATRVAGASTAIWKDIYLANADMLVGAIDELTVELADVRAMLIAGDGDALVAWNELARARHRS
ncbi:MAG TPA: prephenate dehydrogenase/arogenate dehydrogenase family protein [Solirubrobacteraceae bacterium]